MSASPTIRIITNFVHFPEKWTAANGMTGQTIPAATAADFRRHRGPDTVWLVNCETALTLKLAAFKLLAPNAASLIVVDLVMRAPRSAKDRLLHPIKRFLLGRVDHFIHYFRDLTGYSRVFGIGEDRSSFVPFKVNLVDRYSIRSATDGEYAICLGRSMRDFDTFFDAVGQLSIPAAITTPDPAMFARHSARFTRPLDQLPANVRVLEDDGTDESFIHMIEKARLVVLPVLRSSMAASGISTALNAMILRKCVIGTEGPGMSDIFFDGEVLIAPPEDADALAALIRRAWEDDALRAEVAEAGYRYALEAGGEPQLYQRLIDRIAEWRSKRGK